MALAACQGVINAFDMPGRQAFLVQMVQDREDLPNAIALNSTMVHAARLIGPAAAGFLIAYLGEALCFFFDGLSYAAVIAALLAMRVPPNDRPAAEVSVLASLKEGLHYVATFHPVRDMLLLLAVLSLTGVPAFTTLMPLFADFLRGGGHGAQTLGLLTGASGLGALAGALYLASRHTVVGLGRVIVGAAVLLGVSLIAFSLSRQLWLSLLITPAAGLAMLLSFASANTVLQTLVEDDKRGRVMSFFTMAFIGVAPFGNLLAGAAAKWLDGGETGITGAARTVAACGAACLVAALVFARRLPALRDLVRPVYVRKGILRPPAEDLPEEVATGIEAGTEVVTMSNPER
jgi:MFS family permease